MATISMPVQKLKRIVGKEGIEFITSNVNNFKDNQCDTYSVFYKHRMSSKVDVFQPMVDQLNVLKGLKTTLDHLLALPNVDDIEIHLSIDQFNAFMFFKV